MLPHIAVLFALLASSATAVPQPFAQEPSPPPLRSWEITRFTISEGPFLGEARCRDFPVNNVWFDVRDPNRYSGSPSSSAGGSSTANCTMSFPSCSPPIGTFVSCTTTSGVGNWTFSFAPAEITDADRARWNPWAKSVVVLRLALPEQTFEAQMRLSTDDNLQVICNVIGTCAFILKQWQAALLVTPTKVPTVGE